MSRLRMWLFKQHAKIQIFSLMMLAINRWLMQLSNPFIANTIIVVAIAGLILYMSVKIWEITADIYAISATLSCLNLGLVSLRFSIIAFRIDFRNILVFFGSLLLFTFILLWYSRRKKRKKHHQWTKIIRKIGWGFSLFFFFYQLVLGYILRPNFLIIMALTLSHLTLIWWIYIYFDMKQLYGKMPV